MHLISGIKMFYFSKLFKGEDETSESHDQLSSPGQRIPETVV